MLFRETWEDSLSAGLPRSRAFTFRAYTSYSPWNMAPPQALQKYKSKDIKMDPLSAKGMIKNMIKDFSLRFSLKNQWYLRCPECSDWYVKVNYTVECWTVLHSIYNLHNLTLSEKKSARNKSVECDFHICKWRIICT